jgi:hypothetical protein
MYHSNPGSTKKLISKSRTDGGRDMSSFSAVAVVPRQQRHIKQKRPNQVKTPRLIYQLSLILKAEINQAKLHNKILAFFKTQRVQIVEYDKVELIIIFETSNSETAKKIQNQFENTFWRTVQDTVLTPIKS